MTWTLTNEGRAKGDYTPAACRNLVAALLLKALKDAARGDKGAAAWVLGAEALTWADTLGLARWPPKIGARLGRRGSGRQR